MIPFRFIVQQGKNMKKVLLSSLIGIFSFVTPVIAEDNALTESERTDGWKLLFNGKDLTDWQIDKWNPESISVEDGAIKCHGKPSMIYYSGKRKNVKDFHFAAPIGHEAQINQTQKDPVKTGSVYIVKKHLEAPAKDNEWFHYEIIVKGNRIETKVNGKTVVVYEEPTDVKGKRKLSEGTFGIQAHDPGSIVLVKNIKVKLL